MITYFYRSLHPALPNQRLIGLRDPGHVLDGSFGLLCCGILVAATLTFNDCLQTGHFMRCLLVSLVIFYSSKFNVSANAEAEEEVEVEEG